jgi:DNA-binding NtrC family response regulator
MATLLIADSEQPFLDFMVGLLKNDHQLLIAHNWNEVLEKFESNLWRLNAAILDVNMPGLSVDPFSMVEKLLKSNPTVPMVIISGHNNVMRHEFLKMGVFQYHSKPLDIMDLKLTVNSALEFNRVVRRLENFEKDERDEIKYYQRLLRVELNDIKEQVKANDTPTKKTPILIRSEAGSRPYMLAKIITTEIDQQLFFRKSCSENLKNIVPHNLQNGDTLFLEGIEKLDREEQTLLYELFDDAHTHNDLDGHVLPQFRLIASTGVQNESELNGKLELAQLLNKLSLVEFRIEPLRLRKHELKGVVSLIFEKFKREKHSKAQSISNELYDLFAEYNWPLNFDELFIVMEALLLTCPDPVVQPKHLQQLDFSDIVNSKYPTLDDMVQEYIKKALRVTMGNKSKAAKMLGITPKTLYARIRN